MGGVVVACSKTLKSLKHMREATLEAREVVKNQKKLQKSILEK